MNPMIMREAACLANIIMAIKFSRLNPDTKVRKGTSNGTVEEITAREVIKNATLDLIDKLHHQA